MSDHYPGYDGLPWRQQKCWVHLVRDLNDDLWKCPFDEGLQKFVLSVKELIMPILWKPLIGGPASKPSPQIQRSTPSCTSGSRTT